MKISKKLICAVLIVFALIAYPRDINTKTITFKEKSFESNPILRRINLGKIKSFRRDYKYVAQMVNGKWEESIASNTILVFDANDKKDINIYYESGKKNVLTTVGKINEHSAANFNYQIAAVLTEDGYEAKLTLFDDSKLGVYLMFDDKTGIQFHD